MMILKGDLRNEDEDDRSAASYLVSLQPDLDVRGTLNRTSKVAYQEMIFLDLHT